MTSPMISEALMRDRQRRVEQASANDWQRQLPPGTRRTPLRTGAGLMLVRAGLRLAHVEPSALRPVAG